MVNYMKVLLTQNVLKLGKAGEIVEVSDGYGKNYLLPRKLGIEATKTVINEYELKKGSEAVRRERERQEALALQASLKGKAVTITGKAGEGGKLFGSITGKEIAEAVKDQLGLDIDKKKIVLKDAIKAVGTFSATLKLYTEINAELTVKVEEKNA